MDIMEFAMQMELDGKAHYEKLAAGTPKEGLKTIFRGLAEDEQKHYEAIQRMKEGVTGTMLDTPVLEQAQNVFDMLIVDKIAVESLRADVDGYRYAMKVEADSVRLYEDAATKAENPDHAQLFLKIANEEKKHYNIMENLYGYLLEPEYFLEWREFSNLREL